MPESDLNMILPKFHDRRFELNDEVHARPPQAIIAPARASFLVLTSNWTQRDQDAEPVRELARRHHISGPEPGMNYFVADFETFRMKWERHTEFTRYTFFLPGLGRGDNNTPFADPALNSLPEDWIASLPGDVMVAAHAAITSPDRRPPDFDAMSRDLFAGNMLVGASMAGGLCQAVTDFRIQPDGFSRILVQETSPGNGQPRSRDKDMMSWQTGRILQRLLDVETYRMMALLALPLSRELTPILAQQERELEQITSGMAGTLSNGTEANAPANETALLDRLMRLQAAIESRHSNAHYRFSAATAYYGLVRQRISELRETRIEGLQTFQEFTERRLAPAMNTCGAVAARQASLSTRVARATQLLSTRVDVEREKQNQSLLASMDRRAAVHLRLQETVEGLSVAAITYYVVGLINYAAKAVKAAGVPLDPTLVVGLSIPLVAIAVALGVRSIRKHVAPPASAARTGSWWTFYR